MEQLNPGLALDVLENEHLKGIPETLEREHLASERGVRFVKKRRLLPQIAKLRPNDQEKLFAATTRSEMTPESVAIAALRISRKLD
jgi:hypothetical protein